MGGYVLPFGQMSFWGATVITNLFSPFPCLVEWVCGGYCVCSPTLKRFFLFHFQLPFFPFILLKDFFGFLLILCLYFLQIHFGISSLSHPDNALEVCALLTPLHIVPEWYFLCQYAMLKAVPNKNAGFIILLTSVLILFLFGEIRNLTTFTRLMDSNGFSLSFFFLSFLSLDRCSIPSREVSILWSYLDITLLFSSYVYLIFLHLFSFLLMTSSSASKLISLESL